MVALFVFDAENAEQVRPADDEATEGRDDGRVKGARVGPNDGATAELPE